MLEPRGEGGYSDSVSAAAGAGRRNQKLGAPAPSTGAFFMRCPSMAGDAGQTARSGRVPSSRFATPASFATLAVASDVANSTLTRSPS